MKPAFLIFLILTAFQTFSQQKLAAGEQPQISVDSKGTIRLVYGDATDNIYCATSTYHGKTFAPPVLVAQVPDMHLGMTRGPQVASSKDFSIITAMDQKGNIHAFRQLHKSGKWEKIANVNDRDGSAPEGLMAIAADNNNNFYAVWLDLRNDRKNNVCFASLNDTRWSANKFLYKSPESHVCECCKPSIAVNGKTVAIMFRNWLNGSRDLYLMSSSDQGKHFSAAEKLGNGTWPLKGCPMDGGGLTIDSQGQIHTAWQREGVVYYAVPRQPEQSIGDGRSVSMTGNLITWQMGSDLIVKEINGEKKKIGVGTALKVLPLSDNTILAAWEQDDQIFFAKN